jgi:hypothetical protein
VKTKTRAHLAGAIKIWQIVVGCVVLVLVLVFLGLGDGLVTPNVRVSYRPSLVGADYVLVIVNAGSKPLFNVTVTCDDWKKAYTVAQQLDVGGKVEAGWVELPEGCKPGKLYKVSAEGYPGSKKVSIPVSSQ